MYPQQWQFWSHPFSPRRSATTQKNTIDKYVLKKSDKERDG
jgi:hypothetical protein